MTRIWPAAGYAALALAATGCGNRRDAGEILAAGHVEATDIRISAKVGGRVESFDVKEGDSIAAGQELARLATIDARLTLQQAKAERDAMSAELRLRLAGARKEDIAELESQLRSAQSELAGAERDLDRMQRLLDTGSGTTKARDDARTKRDMSAARVDAMQQSLGRLKAGSRAEELDGARARVAAADARISQLEQQLVDATITSPASGVVTEKTAELGELMQPGSPVCVVTDLAHAWLTVYVSEPDLSRIRLGQEAAIRTDDGQARNGHITFIASKAEFTPKNVQTRDERVKLVYKVKLDLDNQDGLFKPGMPAEARLRAVGSAP